KATQTRAMTYTFVKHGPLRLLDDIINNHYWDTRKCRDLRLSVWQHGIRLVIRGWCVVCAGARVPLRERPSLQAQRKLTRQAW
ncbi:hypothetical protein KUCAC02_009169, partial [Chaenocephalus aceratus]